MSTEKDCIFCKIIRGELPSSKIYEDKDFLAFLTIEPVHKGHALIIPKKHCINILDFPQSEETDLIEAIKKVAKAITEATNADGFNINMNNGKAAGQAVFHAHFHIIPRFNEDKLIVWPHASYSPGEMDEVKKKIASFLK